MQQQQLDTEGQEGHNREEVVGGLTSTASPGNCGAMLLQLSHYFPGCIIHLLCSFAYSTKDLMSGTEFVELYKGFPSLQYIKKKLKVKSR